jgi:hypothetical protein
VAQSSPSTGVLLWHWLEAALTKALSPHGPSTAWMGLCSQASIPL